MCQKTAGLEAGGRREVRGAGEDEGRMKGGIFRLTEHQEFAKRAKEKKRPPKIPFRGLCFFLSKKTPQNTFKVKFTINLFLIEHVHIYKDVVVFIVSEAI